MKTKLSPEALYHSPQKDRDDSPEIVAEHIRQIDPKGVRALACRAVQDGVL